MTRFPTSTSGRESELRILKHVVLIGQDVILRILCGSVTEGAIVPPCRHSMNTNLHFRPTLATESLQDRGQTFYRSNRDRVDHKLHMGDPLGSEGAELIGEFLG